MSIFKIVKRVLFSRITPTWLFELYFRRKQKRQSLILKYKLDNHSNLLDEFDKPVQEYWEQRIAKVVEDPSNKDIPRSKRAGRIVDDIIYMHNDIAIDPLSYYSYPVLEMLRRNKGVHEPQEEKVFQEVMLSLEKSSALTMIELGSYWSFYSIWFKKNFANARTIMVEPHRWNLHCGKLNFRLNQLSGLFLYSGISSVVNFRRNETTVDQIARQYNVEFIDILHSDIQGYEFEMIKGAATMLKKEKIGYVFISTHSNELHSQCRTILQQDYGFQVVASANLDESYSWDGVLVMKSPKYNGIAEVEIAKRALNN